MTGDAKDSGSGDAASGERAKPATGRVVGWLLLFLLLAGVGGTWWFLKLEADRKLRLEQQLAGLEAEAVELTDARRWDEAESRYARIELLDPDSPRVGPGRLRIAEGKREEREQFVGYWSGGAIAAFEGGRLDDAAAAARKVLERYPDQQDIVELLERIEAARLKQLRDGWRERVTALVEARDWAALSPAMERLAEELPDDPLVAELQALAEAERDLERRELARARELADRSRERDRGEYDAEVLAWMREAVALAPDDTEIRALYEKIAAYVRTLRVPEDWPDLRAALAEARDRDRIVLGEGSFEAGVVIRAAVQLEGAGEGLTVLEVAAGEGPVLAFDAAADGAQVSGLVFRPQGFDGGPKRFPAVLVEGAGVKFSDCVFRDGSGHGLTATRGGHAEVLRSTVTHNGWGGLAARDSDSRVEVRESRIEENFGHGAEAWEGASLEVVECRIRRNSGNGVLIDTSGEELGVRGNEIRDNREYGLVLAAGGSGEIERNRCSGNALGGMVVRFAALAVRVGDNRLEKNRGPGLVLEQGLRPELYDSNVTSGNRDRQTVVGATLHESP